MYVGSNPATATDPSGLFPPETGWLPPEEYVPQPALPSDQTGEKRTSSSYGGLEDIIDEAELRRGHGPWKDSAQHCWAACYIGTQYGLGNLAAIVADIGELLEWSCDSWRDIRAQHYGAGRGNTYGWLDLFGSPSETPEDFCDNACDTWPSSGA